MLSNTFTNALEEVTEGLLISFPDDTKLGRPVVMLKDRAAIQVAEEAGGMGQQGPHEI